MLGLQCKKRRPQGQATKQTTAYTLRINRNLQRHRAVSLRYHGSVVRCSFADEIKIICEIIFKVLQPMWLQYLNVTDRRTDEHTTCHGNTALVIALRSKNRQYRIQCESKIPTDVLWHFFPNGWEFLVQILHFNLRFYLRWTINFYPIILTFDEVMPY